MKPYVHQVQYYETDKMGITHHSNYIRWMEEARVAWLDEAGWGLDKLEKEGILIPTTAISFRYKHTTTFHDRISLVVRCTAFNGVSCTLSYEVTNEAGEAVGTGTSEHVFMNSEYKFLRMKREFPALYTFMMENTESEENIQS